MNYSKLARLFCVVVTVLTVLFLKVGVAQAASSPRGIIPHLMPGLRSSISITNNELNDFAAFSARDAWAVGDHNDNGKVSETLTEHWNGTIWRIVPSPSPGSNLLNVLYRMAVISTNDVWAVGFYGNSNFALTVIEHWNGKTWSVVPSPNPGGTGSSAVNLLWGVAAISTNDVWAVGYYYNVSASQYQTLSEHWNGTSWSVVPSPNPGGSSNYTGFTGVTAVSANDIWAVGYYNNQANTVYQPVAAHWNGTSWSVSRIPGLGSSFYVFNDVASISSNDVWAVGLYADSKNIGHTLTEHWNGTSWSVVPSQNYGGSSANNYFIGVGTISSSNVWSVGGSYISGNIDQVLIEQWNGRAWTIIPPG